MRLIRIAAAVLLLCALTAGFAVSAAGAADPSDADAVLSGSSESYVISTAKEYLTYAMNIASGDRTYASASYRLANSIGFYGVAFMPFGVADNPFTGVFDGCGYCLNDITYSTSRDACGVFGAAENAVIKNLGVVNIKMTVSGKAADAGLLVGRYTKTVADTGTSPDISRCFASGSLTVNSRKGATVIAGGLIGNINAEAHKSAVRISDVYTNVTVTVKNPTMAVVGGIAGKAGCSCSDGSFLLCRAVSAGTLNASATSSANAGGLIGFLHNDYRGWSEKAAGGASLLSDETNDDIRECFSNCETDVTASITVVSPSVAGSAVDAAKYKLCYGKSFLGTYDAEDIAVEDGKIADAAFLSDELGFDFDTVWTLSADGTMPDLRRNTAVIPEDETCYEDGYTTLRTAVNSTRAALLAAAAYDTENRLICTVCVPVTKDLAQTIELPSEEIPAVVKLFVLDGATPLCVHALTVPVLPEE